MKTRKNTIITAAVLMGSLLTSSTNIWAEEENPYIIHRQAIYKIADGHMQALKSIIFLGHPARQDIKFHATQMLDAFKHHGNAYPVGSNSGETRAKTEIWSKPKEYKQKAKEMGAAINEMIELSQLDSDVDQDAATRALVKMGKGCKGCHDDFRKKSD